MKKYFNTPRQITNTVYDPISLEQFEQLIEKEKPTEIWHPDWSSRMPCLVITEYNVDGFLAYWNWNEDKTPKLMNAQKVFRILRFQYFGRCYINVDYTFQPVTSAEVRYNKNGSVQRKFTKGWLETKGETDVHELPAFVGSVVLSMNAMIDYIEVLHDEIDKIKKTP